MLLLTAPAVAQPISGRHVPEFEWLDIEALDFMADFGISGGIVGVAKDGCIVYQRGFGWHDASLDVTMPENALVRIASCNKPLTAAAIRRLDADGYFEFGLDTFAFDLAQPGGGVLPHDPWPNLVDWRLDSVTLEHLLRHRAGWERAIAGDLTYEECTIAGDFGVDSPPGRDRTMRWILGQPLQHDPGGVYHYSNIGYLALGLIAEQVTGQNLIDYLRQNILTPDMWVPASDLQLGRTFEVNQPSREAWYDGSGGDHCVFDNGECVFGCATAITNSAYGSWDHEARVGQGGIILSAATALRFLSQYRTGVGSTIGLPLNGVYVNESHGGSQDGVNTLFCQRADGVCVFIFFNEDADGDGEPDDPDHFARAFYERIKLDLDFQEPHWPTLCIDGFWVKPQNNAVPSFHGSYNQEFYNVSNAVNVLTHGSRLNFKPGTYGWTGTISTKLQLRAPLGAARIGG
jgi:hypothetical protein